MPIASVFRRGVTWMFDVVCMHASLGASSPGIFLKLNALHVIASETILEQKHAHDSSYTWPAEYCIHFVAVYLHLLSQLTSNFHDRKYYGWQNSRLGDRW